MLSQISAIVLLVSVASAQIKSDPHYLPVDPNFKCQAGYGKLNHGKWLPCIPHSDYVWDPVPCNDPNGPHAQDLGDNCKVFFPVTHDPEIDQYLDGTPSCTPSEGPYAKVSPTGFDIACG